MKAYKHILFLLFFGLLTLQQVNAKKIGKPTLQKVANLMQDGSAFRNKMTAMGKNWEDELALILNRNQHLDNFTNIGHFKRGQSMSEFLEDVNYLCEHFDQSGDAANLFNWIKRESNNGLVDVGNPNLSEFYQTIQEIKKGGYTQTDFAKNRKLFPLDDYSKKFDLSKPSIEEFTELKNKPFPNASISTNSLSTPDIQQVIASNGYFAKITSLDKFKWKAFLKRGTNNNIDNLKQLWKKAFLENETTAFQTIWNNTSLRGSLFGDIINNAPNLETAKSISANSFNQLINDTSSSIYDFIKVE